ncbi:uncharacterized protein E0L32_011603 [Thyridium curvatum]|uniref:Heterokaryon incompatibility domain-containing protein n=1 Tax=Thyridium curvatum TaxID=1093900 RepID=A0A507BP05_9PEZI|nr:uncharacterized protein E0L32_011603 [Thyridium curvatum]TPX18490.1 hypothetical protein E0L32_011603 [Thyridium curvatum]
MAGSERKLKLCERCTQLPLQTLFTTPRTLHKLDDVDVQLGTLREISTSRECRLCGLLKYTIEQHYGAQYVLSKLNEQRGCVLVCNQSPHDLQKDIINDPGLDPNERIALYLELHTSYPVLERLDRDTGDEYEAARIAPKIHLLLDDDSGSNETQLALFGRQVATDAIDWHHVLRWLDKCEAKHGSEASKAHLSEDTLTTRLSGLSLDFQLTVIDVARGCIMPLPEGARYIALSYMWGKDQKMKQNLANRDAMAQPGFFDQENNRPSTTIVHAMEVTRKLGCRYVWIDALCITQDDMENVLQNVNRMDQVYEVAWLTIVAAAGIDADSGLPGVDKAIPRTKAQMQIDINGLKIANMLDSHSDAINFSRWNSRGWTYQERLLSKRLLTFTESQVYYVCDQGCYGREDLHPDDGTAMLTDFDARYSLDYEIQDLFEAYGMSVAEYTKRNFTDPKDKIRALLGALNRLTGPFRGPFYFGIPSTLFDVGLLWTPVGTCTRDKTFPSWSWAGWVGPVRYQKKDSFTNMGECTASQCLVEASGGVQLCHTVECPTKDREASMVGATGEVWQRHVDEDTLGAYYTLQPESPDAEAIRYPRPLRLVGDPEARLLAADKEGTLTIQGKVAEFRLTDQHTDMFVLRSGCDNGRHLLCHLAVFNSHGNVAGTVFVDGSFVPYLKDKTHSFLALSRTTLNRTDVDPSWDDDEQYFRSWHHPESGTVADPDSYESYNREPFDLRIFKDYKYWPVFNVLLLSAPDEDGKVERLGIGKIHVDAFLPVAVDAEIKLG